MKEIKSVFDLALVSENLYKGQDPQLLIVTSSECYWCQQFAHEWREISSALGSDCQVYVLSVQAAGGERILREGMGFFFQHDIGESIGYPSIYLLGSATLPIEISPEVFWDPQHQHFLRQQLVTSIRERILE